MSSSSCSRLNGMANSGSSLHKLSRVTQQAAQLPIEKDHERPLQRLM